MGKYWINKTDGVDTILAENFNDAFAGIESDIAQKADKASTDSALEQKADKTSVDAEISGVNVALERIKYYGSADVVPSDESYFTVNETGETITGLTDTGKTKTELVIPYKINGVKITRIENQAFYRCSSVTSITIPNSVYNFGSYAVFEECTSLKTINIPTGVSEIGESAFSKCTSLTSINLPDSIKYIYTAAFSGCTALASIKIPDGASISFNAFSDCISLTKIEIPNSVTSIGTEAFKGCTSLAIYCEQGSYAETYAKENNIPVVYTDISSAELDKKANDEDVIKQVNEGKQIKLILDSESLTNVVLTPTELYFDNIGSGISGRFSAKEAKIRASDGEHFLSKKANTADVLSKTNTIEFTPTAAYQPATKKYVDDAISAYDTEVMALLGGDAE